MKYIDPFLGEIELRKIGERSNHALGMSRIDSVFIDNNKNYYIQTKNTFGEETNMIFVHKEIIDIINKHHE